MNQILSNQFFEPNLVPKKYKKMKAILFICIFIIAICIILYIYLRYDSLKKAKIAKNLEYKFELQNLYSSANNEYTAIKLNTDIDTNKNEPFVIGLLKIEKINLMYPILSTISNELLEISPCRFFGPMPNEIGNMCIAGHNYANQTHFAKLHLLAEGDIIQIYDLNGNKIDYNIYSKSDLPANDTSCLSQNTNSLREITLVTCNTVKGNRTVLKAKQTAI